MRLTPNDNICEPAKPDATDWKSIKWYKVNRHVDSLQKRIYRASKNNDKKKVRDLQRQLMRSNSALLKAINRVTKENGIEVDRKVIATDTYSPVAQIKKVALTEMEIQ